MNVDFGRTSQDYGRHRAGFSDELFTRLATLGVGHAGTRVLDLGTGTGALASGFGNSKTHGSPTRERRQVSRWRRTSLSLLSEHSKWQDEARWQVLR